jgi:uncharacterized cofD-like protein
MSRITGDFAQGVQEISRVLNVKGKVIPASNDHITLSAEYTDGSIVRGESNIPLAGKPIRRVYLEPESPRPMPEAVYALEQADLIVLGPGSLYTSIIPSLLVPGMKEALLNSKARTVYICNVMTQPGETDNYSVADHIQAINNHAGGKVVNSVLINSQKVPGDFAAVYEEQGASPVVVDEDRLIRMNVQIIADELVTTNFGAVRHDAMKVSQRLVSLL